jgi:hypothetical protein
MWASTAACMAQTMTISLKLFPGTVQSAVVAVISLNTLSCCSLHTKAAAVYCSGCGNIQPISVLTVAL